MPRSCGPFCGLWGAGRVARLEGGQRPLTRSEEREQAADVKKSLMIALGLSVSLLSGVSSASAPQHTVHFDTRGLKTCQDGGEMTARLDVPGAADVLADIPIPGVTLTHLAATSPVWVVASAADGRAGLSVPSGQTVTLSLRCGPAYAATQFTPGGNLELSFTFARRVGTEWSVWVGDVPALAGLPR